MITEKDLQEAIAECQGQRNPNANTCIKLAAFYTIRRELFGEPEQLSTVAENAIVPAYSYAAPPTEQVETIVETNGDSEFLKAVDGRKADKVWKLIDELVEAVKILHPRMYTTFIDKVQDL